MSLITDAVRATIERLQKEAADCQHALAELLSGKLDADVSATDAVTKQLAELGIKANAEIRLHSGPRLYLTVKIYSDDDLLIALSKIKEAGWANVRKNPLTNGDVYSADPSTTRTHELVLVANRVAIHEHAEWAAA